MIKIDPSDLVKALQRLPRSDRRPLAVALAERRNASVAGGEPAMAEVWGMLSALLLEIEAREAEVLRHAEDDIARVDPDPRL